MRKAKKLLAGILAAVVTMTGTGVSFMADNVAVVYAAEPTLSVTSDVQKNTDGKFPVDFGKSIRLTADIADNGGNPGTVDSVSYVWKVSQVVNGKTVTNTFGGKTYTHEASTYGTGEVDVELAATVVYKNNGETTATPAVAQKFSIQINEVDMKKGDAQAMVPDLGTVYVQENDKLLTGDSPEAIDNVMKKVLAGTLEAKFGSYVATKVNLVPNKPADSYIELNYTLAESSGYKPAGEGWSDRTVPVKISNIKVVETNDATYDVAPTVELKTTSGDTITGAAKDDFKLLIGKEQTKVYLTTEPCNWKTNSDAVAIQVSGDKKSATITAVKPVAGDVYVTVTPVYGRKATELKFKVKSYVDPGKVSFPADMEATFANIAAEKYIENHVKGFTVTGITNSAGKLVNGTSKIAKDTYTVAVQRVIDADLEDTVDPAEKTDDNVAEVGGKTVISGDFKLKITENVLKEIAWPALKTTDVNYGTNFTDLLTDNKLFVKDENGKDVKYMEFTWQQHMVGDYWMDVLPGTQVQMDTDWRKYRVVAKVVGEGFEGNYAIPTDKAYKTDYAFTVRAAKISADLTATVTEGVEKVKEYASGAEVTLNAKAETDDAFTNKGKRNEDYRIEWYKDGQKIDPKIADDFTYKPTESGVYHYVVVLNKSDSYKDACFDLSSWSAKSNEIEVVVTKVKVDRGNSVWTGTYGNPENAARVTLDATEAGGKVGIVSYQTYFVSENGTKSAVQSYNVGVTASNATMQCVIPTDTEVGKYKVYFEVKVKEANGSTYTIKTTPEEYTVEQKKLSIATKAIKVSNAIIGGKVSDAVIEYTGADKDLINQGVSFTIADDVKFDQLGTLKNVKVVAALKDTKNFSMDTKDATQESYYVDITVTKAPLTLAAKAVEVTEDAKVVFELENVPAGIDAAKVVYTVTDKLNRVVAANADGSYPIGEYTVTPSYTLDSAAAAVSEVKTVAAKLVVKAGHKSHNPENVSKKVIPATTEKAGYTVDVCKDCDGKEIEGTKKVLCAAIDASSVATKFTTYNYTGAEVKPGIIVKSKTGRRISAANFDVTYKNNTEVGTASYTITFKGNYSGTLTGTFRIVPSGVAALKVVSGENGFTANWSESKGATGYQVVYKSKSCRTTMQMATDTTITVKDARIKAGEVVYVYVKGYKAEDGVQYTSKNWKRRGVKAL